MTKKKASEQGYDSGSARKICTLLYGKVIHAATWASWKTAIGCKRKRKIPSENDFLTICAIAYLRRNIPRRSLTWEEIESTKAQLPLIMQSIESQPKVYRLKDPVNRLKEAKPASKLIRGREIQSYLQKHKIEPPSIATLRRRIPGFAMDDYYSERMILKIGRGFNRNQKATASKNKK